MKTEVILFFLFALLQAKVNIVTARAILNEEVRGLDEDEEACANELHLNKIKIAELNNLDTAPDDNTDFNRFLHCCWQKWDLQDSQGVINYDRLREALQDASVSEIQEEPASVQSLVKVIVGGIVTECENQKFHGTTHGQVAVRVQNCVMKKLNEVLEIPNV